MTQDEIDDLKQRNAELWELSTEVSQMYQDQIRISNNLRRQVNALQKKIDGKEEMWRASVVDEVRRQVRADMRGDLVVALSEFLGDVDV